jgi:putative transposase
LSAIRDLYDGSIISYVLEHSNNNYLVFKTFDQAVLQLNGEQPLVHSDKGFQYTSKGFKRKIDAASMTQSMPRVGRCIDNGPMESFFGTLKCEKYYLHKYKTFEELTTAIDSGKTKLKNACISNIHYHQDRWRIKDFNQISHLSKYNEKE